MRLGPAESLTQTESEMVDVTLPIVTSEISHPDPNPQNLETNLYIWRIALEG